MNWYLEVLKKYAVFSGRARRKEYWMFFLFNILVAVALGIIDGITGMGTRTGFGALGSLYSLVVFIPSLAVCIRRLHDTGHSGWWFLIIFIPCLGGLVLLYFMVIDGDSGDNEYGPSPKAAGA